MYFKYIAIVLLFFHLKSILGNIGEPTDLYEQNDQNDQDASIGTTCNHLRPCNGAKVCVDLHCECPANTRLNISMSEDFCQHFSCESDEQCLTSYETNRYCDQSGRCLCSDGYVDDPDNGLKCIRLDKDPGDCDCPAIKNMVCVDNGCQCEPNYEFSYEDYKCLQFKCRKDRNCQTYDPNRICSTFGTCSCDRGFKPDQYNGGKCKEISYNKRCNKSNLCSNYETCVDSKCKCLSNYKFNQKSRECEHFYCTKDKECQSYDRHRYCNKNGLLCDCKVGYVPDKVNGGKCIQFKSRINEYCSSDRKCMDKINTNINGVKCVDSVCKCAPNYAFNALTNECQYFRCIYSTDCQTYDRNRFCSIDSKQCVCSQGFREDYRNGGKCKLYSYSVRSHSGSILYFLIPIFILFFALFVVVLPRLISRNFGFTASAPARTVPNHIHTISSNNPDSIANDNLDPPPPYKNIDLPPAYSSCVNEANK